MARRPERGRRESRYFLRFAVSAVLLVASTLVLVLFVLPERYILSSGFVEQGQRFPAAKVPFEPVDPVRVGARPAIYREPDVVGAIPAPPPLGPAERFWATVLPMLERREHVEAVPVFERYLAGYPADAGVRREYALTLVAAGRASDAVPVMEGLLRASEDLALRLILARTLRDLDRVDEASVHYALLRDATRADAAALEHEWAQSYSWLGRYDDAERVLRAALVRSPESVPLRGELARVLYYTNRLREAESVLAGMTSAELVSADAVGLLRDVRAALADPGQPRMDPTVPTLLQRAVTAREARQLDSARSLFQEALRERPDDAAIWLAYANFLEYELGDFDGARGALMEVQRLGATDRALQYRIATLEAWTNRRADAITRLEALLAADTANIQPAARDTAAVTAASVLAMMGDVVRWGGNRIGAHDLYRTALESDPQNQRALDGINELDLEVARVIDAAEVPRVGTHVYGLGDTDDFTRLDVAGDWIGVRDDWVWNVSAGRRWLGGRDLESALDDRAGSFVSFSPARWWRLGTIRTGAHIGIQRVRASDVDVSYGAGLRWRALNGASLNAEFRHEPAYDFSPTLEAVLARVELDRFVVTYDRQVGERWSVALQGDLARLDAADIDSSLATTRAQAVVSIGRAMSERWSLGWSSLASTYTEPAPVVGGNRLFWDPSLVVTTGPFARVHGPLGERWEGFVRVNPAIGFIEERGPGDSRAAIERVPQFSAEAGTEYRGRRTRVAFDLFYGQSRVEGYRTYGARISVSGSSWLSDGPPR